MTILIPALTTCLLPLAAGMWLLRTAWRRTDKRARFFRYAAWASFFISLIGWSRLVGVEFGLVIGLACLSLGAWIACALNAEIREPATKTQPKTPQTPTPEPNRRLQKWGMFFVSGPLNIISLCFISMAVSHALPISQTSQMITAALLYPTLIGIAVFYILVNRKPLRDALTLTGLAVVSGLYLFL